MTSFQKTVLTLAATILTCPIVSGQNTGQPAPPQLSPQLTPEPQVSRFYDITPLVKPRHHFGFPDDQSISARGISYGTPGGNLGGGGGGMQGGGFFSVPSTPTQFGGNGSGGLGGGGMAAGGSGTYSQTEISLKEQLESTGDSIVDLIETSVAPDTWEDLGTGAGTIRDLGNTLLIRQTEVVHRQIAGSLRELTEATVGKSTYKLEAWWLPVNEEDRPGIEELLSGKLSAIEINEQLTSLSHSTQGYHATMLCREHITTHTASGKQVPIVVGSTPVVGTGDASDSPIVRSQLLGLMLEVQVSSVPEYIVSMQESASSDLLELSFRSMISSPDLNVQEWLAASGKIDRYTLGKHISEGSCQVKIGEPTLVAALSQLSMPTSDDAQSTPEMQLIIQISRVKEPIR